MFATMMSSAYGLMSELHGLSQPAVITCKKDIARAAQPIFDNTAGQALGVASPLAVAIGIILVVLIIGLSFSRHVGLFMRGLGILVAGVIVIGVLPDFINAFSTATC